MDMNNSSKDHLLRNPKRRRLITLSDTQKQPFDYDDQITFDPEEIGKWIQSNSSHKKKHFLDIIEKKEQQRSLNATIPTEKRDLSHKINESRLKNDRKSTKNPTIVAGTYILDEPDFQDLVVSLTIHLYRNYFTLNDLKCPYPYCRRTSTFLSNIDSEKLPHDLVELLCENSEHLQCNPPTFYEGGLLVEIHDHRDTESRDRKRRVLLKPDSCSLLNDLHEISVTMNLSYDDQISIEQKILTALSHEPGSYLGALCLDPNPAVAYVANQLHFQKNKLATLNKKKSHKRTYYDTNQTPVSVQKTVEPSRFRLLQYLHQKNQLEAQSKGEESQNYSFAMEVHKLLNQTINDQLYPASRETEKNQVPDRSSNPTDLINQIVENVLQAQPSSTDGQPSAAPPPVIPFSRTLKFHLSGGKNLFCVVQVHAKKGTIGYEAVLRVGKLPDNGSNGEVVRFPIGNAESAEKLIVQMKMLYERESTGTLISDSINDPVSNSQPPQSSQLPVTFGFPQNPYASQSQQNLQTSSQNAPTNPGTVQTMIPGQQPLGPGFQQPVNAPSSGNPSFVQMQSSASVGYNMPPNVGIGNIPNINPNPNVAHTPFQLLGAGASSPASAFSQIALAQKFGGAYVSQLKGRTKVNLPPGATPSGMSQHQLNMGMSLPLGTNQIVVNPPSGFPIQPNPGTGNVLLQRLSSNPNQPQNTTNQQNAK